MCGVMTAGAWGDSGGHKLLLVQVHEHTHPAGHQRRLQAEIFNRYNTSPLIEATTSSPQTAYDFPETAYVHQVSCNYQWYSLSLMQVSIYFQRLVRGKK